MTQVKKHETVNPFKKPSADGKILPEEIGKGLNYEHPLVKTRGNDATITFRLPSKEKEALENGSENSSDVLRALTRGWNSQKKNKLKEEVKK